MGPNSTSSRLPAPLSAARKLDRTIGISVILVSFLAAVAVSRWARDASLQDDAGPPAPSTTREVVGWPDAVDPVKTLRAARKLTRRSSLRGFVAEGVRRDGYLDTRGGLGRVRYSFQSPAMRVPRPTQGNTVPGLPPPCGTQSVTIRSDGLGAELDNPFGICPPVEPADALPDPRCTLQKVWQTALERGAPKESLARIEYYRSGIGPAWRFEVPGTDYRFSLYGDCSRVLTPEEAEGFVP